MKIKFVFAILFFVCCFSTPCFAGNVAPELGLLIVMGLLFGLLSYISHFLLILSLFFRSRVIYILGLIGGGILTLICLAGISTIWRGDTDLPLDMQDTHLHFDGWRRVIILCLMPLFYAAIIIGRRVINKSTNIEQPAIVRSKRRFGMLIIGLEILVTTIIVISYKIYPTDWLW